MKEYQAFPISNFRTGFDEAMEPWLLPRDAYQSLINAHLYRGVLEKIDGYNLFANFTYRNIVSLGTPDGATKTFAINLVALSLPLPVTSNFFAYGTIVVATSAETFAYGSDASSTVINLVGSAGGAGTVNISTGAVSITFNAAPPADTYSCIYFSYDSAPIPITAIMGIKQYYAANASQDVLVFDQRRAGKVVPNKGVLAINSGALNAVSEIPHAFFAAGAITGDGATVTFSGTISKNPFERFTATFFQYTSAGVQVTVPTNGLNVAQNVTDNGFGALIGPKVSSGKINYVTGAWTVTFSSAPASGNRFDTSVGIYGNIFSGSISNFISLVNYQYKAFFCNNKDSIYYYDGNLIQYLNTSLSPQLLTYSSGSPTNIDITSCLHLALNYERLILFSPKIGTPQVNAAFWSRAGAPLDWTNDEQLYAPTSEPIRAFSKIYYDIVVRFANSERVFRYTADADSPFRWDSTNSVWECDAPYSAINYNDYFTSVGKPAITRSNGRDVGRADDIIPDFTDPSRITTQTPVPFLNQTSIQQCYGERYDDLKEGWLCYNSSPAAENTVTASDNVLAFNYLDQTYAIYTFPFSCLGFGRIINVPTWGTILTPWQEMLIDWGSYQLDSQALISLSGDQFDKIYQLNIGTTQTVAGDATTTPTPVLMSVISKNFNPFIEQGQLARLGYIDLLVTANATTKLRVQFFINDELYEDSSGNPAGFYQENTLTFVPTDAMSSNRQVKVWKRIYVGSTGKAHTIRFYQNSADFSSTTQDQPVYIHAMVLYIKPAGRIFN